MARYQIAEAKSHFSEVLKIAESGEPVEITRGKKQETIAYIIPPSRLKSQVERDLGTLEHWGEIGIAEDWRITDEELLGL